jgi:hypothetical protein
VGGCISKLRYQCDRPRLLIAKQISFWKDEGNRKKGGMIYFVLREDVKVESPE